MAVGRQYHQLVPLDPPLAFPSVEPGEPVVLSATAFVTYQRCPEQALGRMRGQFPAESRRSFSGNLAHRIFARHLSSGPIPEQGFAAACREEIGIALNPKLSALRLRPRPLHPPRRNAHSFVSSPYLHLPSSRLFVDRKRKRPVSESS